MRAQITEHLREQTKLRDLILTKVDAVKSTKDAELEQHLIEQIRAFEAHKDEFESFAGLRGGPDAPAASVTVGG